MQSLASEEIPFIYALGATGTQAYLIVANLDGYYMQYAITGYTTPTVSAVMSAGRSGRVYIGDTNTIYTSTSSDYSSWSSQAMAFGVLDLASTPFGDYLLQASSADPLYRYEKSSNSWISTGKTILNTPEKMYYSRTYTKLYVTDNSGGNTQLYELGTPAALILDKVYGINPNRIFFAEAGGGFYIGNDQDELYLNGSVLSSTAALRAFAVVSPADIFGGTDNTTPPVMLYRLVNLVFNPELYFSTTGVMRLWPMPPDCVIIGIHASTDADGLYVYNFKKLILKKLSPVPIWAVYSSAQ